MTAGAAAGCCAAAGEGIVAGEGKPGIVTAADVDAGWLVPVTTGTGRNLVEGAFGCVEAPIGLPLIVGRVSAAGAFVAGLAVCGAPPGTGNVTGAGDAGAALLIARRRARIISCASFVPVMSDSSGAGIFAGALGLGRIYRAGPGGGRCVCATSHVPSARTKIIEAGMSFFTVFEITWLLPREGLS